MNYKELDYEDRLEITQNCINGVLNYIKENPDSEPNANEMMTVSIEVNQLAKEGTIDTTKYDEMMNIRMGQLRENTHGLDISEDSPLYQVLKSYQDGRETVDLEDAGGKKDMLCTLVGVNFYIQQQKKRFKMSGENGVLFDNRFEMKALEKYFATYPTSEYERALFEEIEQSYLKEYAPNEHIQNASATILGLEGLVAEEYLDPVSPKSEPPEYGVR